MHPENPTGPCGSTPACSALSDWPFVPVLILHLPHVWVRKDETLERKQILSYDAENTSGPQPGTLGRQKQRLKL